MELPGKCSHDAQENKQSSVASNLMSGLLGVTTCLLLSSVSTMVPWAWTVSENLTVQGEKATFLTLVPLLIWQRPSQICFWNFDGSTFSQIFHGCPAIACASTPKAGDGGSCSLYSWRQVNTANTCVSLLLCAWKPTISLRAFLRSLLSNPQIAETKHPRFLTFSQSPPAMRCDRYISSKGYGWEEGWRAKAVLRNCSEARPELDIYMEELVHVFRPLCTTADHLQVPTGHCWK